MPDASPPRSNREDLIRRALAVVNDAITRSQYDGDLTGDELGLRLALALLYTLARAKGDFPEPPRKAFDELWRAVTNRDCHITDNRQSFRSTWARTQLSGIVRRLGINHLNDVEDPLPLNPENRRRYEAVVSPCADQERAGD